jgi:hypothetical protein
MTRNGVMAVATRMAWIAAVTGTTGTITGASANGFRASRLVAHRRHGQAHHCAGVATDAMHALHYASRRHVVMYLVYSYSVPDSVEGVVYRKAMELLKRVLAYARSKWPEQDGRFVRASVGNTNRVHCVWRVRSLAEGEQFVRTYYQDPGIKAILQEWNAAAKEAGSVLLEDEAVGYYSDIE